ncbi:putative ammonium transporter 3 [Uloborus diversus]|uniref:putative ammonium transporter 3 n=1 Tax=Uloborus diversus TaxID=327109 RepID=UPI00240905E1|nr:putative ammonium transporter 3 [Uloborus diversus]
MNASSPLIPETPVYNSTSKENVSWDDATWIMTSSFIIFTMQSGFGLLESGYVSKKNEVNIMVKNAIDVIFGGLGYWMFGYAFSFGKDPGSNFFVGVGGFFLDAREKDMGVVFSTYIFQLSFATTATTIVSGAMAERCNFVAYCLFSFFNTVIFSLPAGWVWAERGFLRKINVVDIAGCSAVHLVGGASALIAAIMLKPRLGRYDNDSATGHSLGSPTNALVGMFMLWWGWLGFNCGSTFGVSGHKWKYAARSAIVTINSSVGGGIAALIFSYFSQRKKFIVTFLINGILASLVSITGGCALYHPWEALIVGAIGSLLANCTVPLLDRLHVDDPVGAIAVHGAGSLWGMIAVGFFVEKDTLMKFSNNLMGLFRGGGWRLLGVQLLAIIVVAGWSMVTTFLLLYTINKFIPIRMTPEEEKAGADLVEHNILYEFDPSVNRFPKLDLATIHSIKLCIEASQGSNPVINRPVERLNSGTQTDAASPIRRSSKNESSIAVQMPKDSMILSNDREVLTAWMSDDEKNMMARRVSKQ